MSLEILFPTHAQITIFRGYSFPVIHFFFVKFNPKIWLYTNTHICIHKHFFLKQKKKRGIEIEEIIFLVFSFFFFLVFSMKEKKPLRKSISTFSYQVFPPSLSEMRSSERAHLIKILGEW